MSADVVNLRRARKARARSEKQVRAAENRARFGLTKAERLAAEARRTREAAVVDGAEREPPSASGAEGPEQVEG